MFKGLRGSGGLIFQYLASLHQASVMETILLFASIAISLKVYTKSLIRRM